jgi:hypothetical protein
MSVTYFPVHLVKEILEQVPLFTVSLYGQDTCENVPQVVPIFKKHIIVEGINPGHHAGCFRIYLSHNLDLLAPLV